MKLRSPHMRVFMVALLLGGSSLQADPVLAGHPGLKSQALDTADIKALLLGKRVTLGDTRVIIVIVKTSPGQENFLQAHTSMTTGQFKNYWRRLFMTGNGSAPKIVETEADAVKIASETPGALVIVDSAQAAPLIVLATN